MLGKCVFMCVPSGGLDLVLVGGEVGVAWQRKLIALRRSVCQLQDAKRKRDRKILLALFTNAARSTLSDNVMCIQCTPIRPH